MSHWDSLRELALQVDGYRLEPLELQAGPDFVLRRTVVVLYGGGEEGRGEEVDYDPQIQQRFQEHGGDLPLRGRHTLESFSLLHAGQAEYRRWAFESAALDLALRQAGATLADRLRREPAPLRFVVSTRIANVPGWSELYPGLRYKLDADAAWTDELMRSLGGVETVDFKGVYRGEFGSPPNAELYRRVAGAFPGAWLEDPCLTPETTAALEPHRERITWDAAIHDWGDVEALPFTPRCLNCKPSRFGSVRRLLHFYEQCERHGIALYGGGQYELGPGRGQIQLLASLFHPDAPNDVAPGAFNEPPPRAGLPESPLALRPGPGFSA